MYNFILFLFLKSLYEVCDIWIFTGCGFLAFLTDVHLEVSADVSTSGLSGLCTWPLGFISTLFGFYGCLFIRIDF